MDDRFRVVGQPEVRDESDSNFWFARDTPKIPLLVLVFSVIG